MKIKSIILFSLMTVLVLAACAVSPGAGGMTLETIKPVATAETLTQNSIFRDDLSADISKGWGLKVISGLEKQLIWSQDSSQFRIKLLSGNDTNFVFINKTKSYQDVVVKAEGRYLESSSAYMSVICRASSKGWYEFRINSQGFFQLLKFDQYLKDQGKNAYADLIGGQLRSTLVKTGKAINQFALSCKGKELKAFINNEQVSKDLRPLVIEDSSFSDGGIGFGVSSNGNAADLSYNFIETLRP
jgi:hypothetical protein